MFSYDDIDYEDVDWERLHKLRDIFCEIDGQRRSHDYWLNDRETLEAYHQTLAQRIGWKWQAVLNELEEKASWLKEGIHRLIDFGCGTGIQTLYVLRWLNAQHVKEIVLIEQSAIARQVAQGHIKREFPHITVAVQSALSDIKAEAGDLFLASHVINELTLQEREVVAGWSARFPRLLWVEAGTHVASRSLSAVRDHLLRTHHILAPCPHQHSCPVLRENEHDWCHFFAKPPTEVFHSRFWRKFSEELKVDLRSLPLAFLVGSTMERQSIPKEARAIGRPQILKTGLRFLSCSETGLGMREVSKKHDKALFKAWQKDCFCCEW